jgi:hypothetical protein
VPLRRASIRLNISSTFIGSAVSEMLIELSTKPRFAFADCLRLFYLHTDENQ